jgi:single-strand DNA-binding protein
MKKRREKKMNKVIIKGRLTANPEKKMTVSDVAVCDFTVAVNRRFNKDITDFINCQAWRNTAEFVTKYFKKGQEILVVGELHIDRYEKDGETRYSTRVSVEEVDFCGSKNDNATISNAQEEEKLEVYDFREIPDEEEEIPF